MGKVYSDVGGFAPTAVLKEEGAMLKGICVSFREVKTQWGPKPVYTFKVIEATCKFTLGKEEVEPNEGDPVDVFATTRLDRQLSKVPVGDTVTITYLGLGKNAKGMNKPHMFSVVGE